MPHGRVRLLPMLTMHLSFPSDRRGAVSVRYTIKGQAFAIYRKREPPPAASRLPGPESTAWCEENDAL
jgi:hypothetical protein